MPIINKAKRAKRLDAKVNKAASKAASKAAPKPKRYTRKEALQDAKTNRVVKKIKAPAVKKITVKTKATKKPLLAKRPNPKPAPIKKKVAPKKKVAAKRTVVKKSDSKAEYEKRLRSLNPSDYDADVKRKKQEDAKRARYIKGAKAREAYNKKNSSSKMKTMEYKPKRDGIPKMKTMEYKPKRDGNPKSVLFNRKKKK
jgi:hypothetical protein